LLYRFPEEAIPLHLHLKRHFFHMPILVFFCSW
jgi:hypothetical protein